jgi:hypothetical protein
MKIWWPWRKMKPVLSLFEGRVTGLGEDATAKPVSLSGNRRVHPRPHPKNAPGSFSVENEECITCGAAHVVAPDLMGWVEDANQPGSHNHCYFKKQPSEPGELKQALDAIAVSCCGALYYSGSDPEVLRELRKSGNGHAIVKPRGR